MATDSSAENRAPTQRFTRSRLNDSDRRRMAENLREVDFPIAMRGYDRAAVDRYVKEVNRVIAELELSSSPEAAVRHALDEVSEETSGLLQRAYETSEEITARSRAKADDRVQQAERDAEALREAAAHEASETSESAARNARELREAAQRDADELRASAKQRAEQLRTETEARLEELERNAEAVWRERRRLIEDMRAVAKEQLEIAEAAMARFPQTSTGTGAKQPDTEGPEQS